MLAGAVEVVEVPEDLGHPPAAGCVCVFESVALVEDEGRSRIGPVLAPLPGSLTALGRRFEGREAGTVSGSCVCASASGLPFEEVEVVTSEGVLPFDSCAL